MLSTVESWALPPCPGIYDKNTWGNCHGTYAWPDGSYYVGEFKDNNRHGQGTHTYGPNSKWAGDKYVGEFKDGKRTGQGSYTYSDGDIYVGEFKDGRRHGQGSYTWTDGRVEEGIWKNNEYAHSLASVTNNQKGNSYRDGDGVLQNHKEALRFYLQSAEGGNKDSMLNIAFLYQHEKVADTLSLTDRISDWWNETDSTPSRGRIKAYMWANLAGDDLRDEIAESLTASELEEAQALSSACLKKNYKGC